MNEARMQRMCIVACSGILAFSTIGTSFAQSLDFFQNVNIPSGDISPFEDSIELWKVEEGGKVLNPVAVGLPFHADEVPELRTEKTATFDLGNGRFAATSNASPIFTHEDSGVLVPIEEEGSEDSNSFVFRHLPEDVRVRFDLTHPSVRLWQRGKGSFVIRFRVNATGIIESEDSVTYQLNPSTLLRWKIVHNRIKQEIWVTDHSNKADLAFSITPDAGLTLEKNENDFAIRDRKSTILFTLPGPILLDAEKKPIEKNIGIGENNGYFDFSHSSEGLPEIYVIDPSAGPNTPGTMENEAYGGVAWSNTANGAVSDDSRATVNLPYDPMLETVSTSDYLKATNFGFSVPANLASVDGVLFTSERQALNGNICDNFIYLVKNGTVSGTNHQGDCVTPWLNDTDETATYGGSTDLWGLTFTASDINASNFGVVLSANGDISGEAAIDSMQLTVYYTAAASSTNNNQFLFIE